MNVNDQITRFLIKNPEADFQIKTLQHNVSEISDIIDHFQKSLDARQVHRDVISLLQSTKQFQYATEPEGEFFHARNKEKSDDELKANLTAMIHALAKSEKQLHENALSESDKLILQSAYEYCVTSIKKRISVLRKDDRYRPLIVATALKKYLDAE